MSWFSKTGRQWGQIPFNLDDLVEDVYKSEPETGRTRKKTQRGYGAIAGPESHSSEEMSASGPSERQINSLTSGHQIERDLYGGEIMDEDPGGVPRPRTVDQGGPAVGDPPSTLGMEDEGGMGASVLRNTPNDEKPREVAVRNFLRFQRRPSRQVNVNGQNVNVID